MDSYKRLATRVITDALLIVRRNEAGADGAHKFLTGDQETLAFWLAVADVDDGILDKWKGLTFEEMKRWQP